MKMSTVFLILLLFIVIVIGSYYLSVHIVNFGYSVYLFFYHIYIDFDKIYKFFKEFS